MVTIIDVNGAEMYAHTAWAESPDGDSFSTVEFDDADYIGILIDRNDAEETDPTKYTWRYIDISMEEKEEDEEDEDVTADLSSDLEEVVENVSEVADQVNQQRVDFINTQNVIDGAIGNVNELNGTNAGAKGWTVPEGFSISESYEDVESNPDADKVKVSTITRNTSGTDATVTFDASALVNSLSGADAGNAYTLSLQSNMSSLFEIQVSVADPDGTNIMLDFGSLSNAVIVRPEEPEEEDAGTVEASEEDPAIKDIIADEEASSETLTGETAGADAWSWFEATAENASVAASAQALRFDLNDMPTGATLSIANLKIEAGAMATPWRRSVTEVAESAERAKELAEETSQYFWADENGAHATSTPKGEAIAGGNTLITDEGMEVRDGSTPLASFKGDGVKIGPDSGYTKITKDSISLSNGAGSAFDVNFGSAGIRVVETFGGGMSFTRSSSNTTGEIGYIEQITRFPVSDYNGKFWTDWTYTGASGNTLTGSLNISITKGNVSGTEDIGDYGTLSWTLLLDLNLNVKGIRVSVQVDEVGASVLFPAFNWDYTTTADAACQVSTGVNPDKTVPYAFLVGNGSADTPSNAFLVDWDGNVTAKGGITARGDVSAKTVDAREVTLSGDDITELFSGIMSIGYEDKDLSLAAGGNTGDVAVSLSKDGYRARCVCGWNLSGTGSSNCNIARIYVNQTDQQVHYYVKNGGSSKATPTLRIYVLYTKSV